MLDALVVVHKPLFQPHSDVSPVDVDNGGASQSPSDAFAFHELQHDGVRIEAPSARVDLPLQKVALRDGGEEGQRIRQRIAPR